MALRDKPLYRVSAGSSRGTVGRPPRLIQEKTAITGPIIRSVRPAKSGAGDGVFFLPTDEIITRKGWRVYREMRHDDQIKACLSFKKILVHGRKFDIKPGVKDDAEAEKIAEFTDWLLNRINFKRIMREALTALDFGYSVGEKVFELVEWEGSTVVALKDIKHRDPEDIEIQADKHGNIQRFKQVQRWWHSEEVYLEPQDVWHYAHQTEFGNMYGIPDLRAAYRAWWAKKFIINFWNVFLERMGSPMTMMRYPQGSSEQLKSTLKSILTGLSSRSEVLVPEGVEIELIEATRSGTATYEQAVEYQDKAIARALLVVALLGMGGNEVSRGADSQSRLQLRVLFKMADELAQDLIWTFMEQVIRPIIDMNFEHDGTKYPRFIWQDYGEFEGIEVADTIRLLFAAGIFDMDQEDVNYARSILGLPIREEGDEEDELLRPGAIPPPASANSPPPSAGQGNERARKGSSSTAPNGG